MTSSKKWLSTGTESDCCESWEASEDSTVYDGSTRGWGSDIVELLFDAAIDWASNVALVVEC